jgi:hypothetical protein
LIGSWSRRSIERRAEIERAPDPRFRDIMSAFVRHLHDFAREVRLTEEESQKAARTIAALGHKTNARADPVPVESGFALDSYVWRMFLSANRWPLRRNMR